MPLDQWPMTSLLGQWHKFSRYPNKNCSPCDIFQPRLGLLKCLKKKSLLYVRRWADSFLLFKGYKLLRFKPAYFTPITVLEVHRLMMQATSAGELSEQKCGSSGISTCLRNYLVFFCRMAVVAYIQHSCKYHSLEIPYLLNLNPTLLLRKLTSYSILVLHTHHTNNESSK